MNYYGFSWFKVFENPMYIVEDLHFSNGEINFVIKTIFIF